MRLRKSFIGKKLELCRGRVSYGTQPPPGHYPTSWRLLAGNYDPQNGNRSQHRRVLTDLALDHKLH